MSASEAHGKFEVILSLAAPALRPVCVALRELVISLDPACTEIVWPRLKIVSFGVGPRKKTQHYAFISVHAKHINLGLYHGDALKDPLSILEGSGKSLRHIKVHELALVQTAAVEAMLLQAIEERRANAPDA